MQIGTNEICDAMLGLVANVISHSLREALGLPILDLFGKVPLHQVDNTGLDVKTIIYNLHILTNGIKTRLPSMLFTSIQGQLIMISS